MQLFPLHYILSEVYMPKRNCLGLLLDTFDNQAFLTFNNRPCAGLASVPPTFGETHTRQRHSHVHKEISHQKPHARNTVLGPACRSAMSTYGPCLTQESQGPFQKVSTSVARDQSPDTLAGRADFFTRCSAHASLRHILSGDVS